MKFLRIILLYPLSIIYGGVTAVRNWLYDSKIKHSTPTPIKTISVGNITVGGTGKTPHSEYLIRLLQNDYRVGYLSRGYKRKSSGFRLAIPDIKSHIIGDEAYQIHTKFPEAIVAVCADRLHALKKMKKLDDAPEIVVLDDAFQHRTIKPDINIVLIDYNRLLFKDYMLPYGELREDKSNCHRADIIIATKCPPVLKPAEMKVVSNNLDLYAYQTLYFTSIVQSEPKAIYSDTLLDISTTEILLVTGTAQPQHLLQHLQSKSPKVVHLQYPDHYNFKNGDLNDIITQFDKLKEGQKAIIITAKDAARLSSMNVPEELKPHLYSMDVGVEFLANQQDKFDKQIYKYIRRKSMFCTW